MEELVIKYLSENYWISHYPDINTIRDYEKKNKIYSNELLDEITEMFDISQITARACIEIYIYDICTTFDMEGFWSSKRHPRGWTTTMNDIVEVRPMGAPRGELMHLDYVYQAQVIGREDRPPEIQRIQDLNDMMDRLRRDMADMSIIPPQFFTNDQN